MIDFIESYCGWLAIFMILVFVSTCTATCYFEGTERARLVRQCMRDGKPEYECKAMVFYGWRR